MELNTNLNFLFEFNDADKITTSSKQKREEKKNIAYDDNNKKIFPLKQKEEYNKKDIYVESEKPKKTHKKRNIIIGIVIFLMIGSIVSNIEQSINTGSPNKISTSEEELNYKVTTGLQELKPISKDEGDAFFYEDVVTDAYGNTMLKVVHPGSTGTVKSTGGGGAHAAQGFNRVYKNEGYAKFTGTLFISDKYSSYTKHVLTLNFEVYGDGNLLYDAPNWKTGNSYNMLPFEIDISPYNEIKIHFEAINDSNLFSWEDCAFGISEATFSKPSIGEQNQ